MGASAHAMHLHDNYFPLVNNIGTKKKIRKKERIKKKICMNQQSLKNVIAYTLNARVRSSSPTYLPNVITYFILFFIFFFSFSLSLFLLCYSDALYVHTQLNLLHTFDVHGISTFTLKNEVMCEKKHLKKAAK